MRSLIVAIDGASRNNGKPECCAAGAAWCVTLNSYCTAIADAVSRTAYETSGSSNQRGEMLGLISALEWLSETAKNTSVIIIIDSEFLFNAMTKEWFIRWHYNDYEKADGAEVKNSDLWERVYTEYSACEEAGIELNWYHIKGHLLPFGKVTAERLLDQDASGLTLYREVLIKYESEYASRGIYNKAAECFIKNNGFDPEERTLRRCVTTNAVADALATKTVEAIKYLG